MGKHITKANSVTICRVYKEHKGKWDKIMADPEIKAMGLQRHQIERHLSYKKSQLPKKKDPLNHDRGEKARQKVLKRLEFLDDDEEEADDLSSTSYHISSEEEPEKENSESLKRTNTDEGVDIIRKKPKLKRELSDASKYLDDLNKDLLSTSVSSSDVQSSEDMIKIKQEAKELTKKEVRSSRIAEKERESKAIASSLKKHQETVESQATVQSTMQMMALQMMQKMMKETSDDDEFHKVEKDVNDLKKDLHGLKDEVKSIGQVLTSIQSSQTQLASIMSELVKKSTAY